MSKPSRVRIHGPLTPFAVGFRAELERIGYRSNAVGSQLQLLAHLSRWLDERGLAVGDLTERTADEFLGDRRTAGYTLWLSTKALVPLVDHLGGLGVLPAREAPVCSPSGVLLDDYCAYLVGERGLADATARNYAWHLRSFLSERTVGDHVELEHVTAADLRSFLLASRAGSSIGTAKLVVTALRSFLGWCFREGLVERSLEAAVPSVAGSRLAGLPMGISASELARMLSACDRRTPAGRRDAAIITVLGRLGLRAGEVCALRLDDIDWRAGELIVTGKGSRVERLPLPAEVGEAIAAYLRRGRPKTAQGRSVFVRVHAPHRELTPAAVTNAVQRVATRAGLGRMSARTLRHSVATQMVRAGAALPEVGQVLRHRRLLTTAIYAKVDREGLRELARPWPGGAA
ncbi:MAG: tyrosine-type recombinase/integrase [Gaiellaceae bacterium]